MFNSFSLRQLWMIIVGQFCLGAGMGGMLVGSFVQGLRETINNGFPDSISTYACISGIFSSAFSFGCALGPLVGGFLVEDIGYRNSTMILTIAQGFLIALIIAYLLCGRSKSSKSSGDDDDAEKLIEKAEGQMLIPKKKELERVRRQFEPRCPQRRQCEYRRIRAGSYYRRNQLEQILVIPRSRPRHMRSNVRDFHGLQYQRQRSHSYCSSSLVQSL